MIIGKKNRQRKKRKSRQLHSGYYPYEIKLKAVELYLEEGYSPSLIAKELGVGKCSISEWARRYLVEGKEGLRPSMPGGRRSQIPAATKEKAIEMKKKHPEYGRKSGFVDVQTMEKLRSLGYVR